MAPNPAGDQDSGTIPARTIEWGLAAASFAGLLTCLQRETLSTPLTVAVYCFAAALPIQVGAGLALSTKRSVEYRRSSLFTFTFIGGLFASVAGITSLFWHVSWGCGVIFLAMTIVCYAYGVATFRP